MPRPYREVDVFTTTAYPATTSDRRRCDCEIPHMGVSQLHKLRLNGDYPRPPLPPVRCLMNSPAPGVAHNAVDERFFHEWVAFGMLELAVYLTRHAQFAGPRALDRIRRPRPTLTVRFCSSINLVSE